MVALSNFMILFPCLILSRPGRQRQLENRIQWPGGKIQSWLMLVSGVGNRCPISACFVPRISRFFSFSSSTVPAQPGYLNNGLAERFDPGRCSWTALTIVALSLPLPCIDFQDFYDFILDCPGPSRKWMTRKPDENNKTLKSSSSSLNSFSRL